MRISCFICNPPYGTQDNPQLCCRIMKQIKNYRAVVISPPPPIFNAFYFNLTSIEQVKFPGIDLTTAISTINDNKPVLFPQIHKLKFVKKSDYFFLKMGDCTVYQIRKENKSIQNRKYIDVTNDTEMEEINKFIIDNWEPYKVFVPCMTCKFWIIANILYNSKWRDRFVK